MYTGFAEVYDQLMNDVNYDAWADFYVRMMNAFGIREGKICECACGTGLLSGVIARRCKSLIATDFSANMLRRAEKKYGRLGNVKFERADILRLDFPDGRFDVVVAANVIHLLDEPYRALGELDRVCRPGGRIIVPTYMNRTDRGSTNGLSKAIGRAGADFRREFTLESYRQFFAEAG